MLDKEIKDDFLVNNCTTATHVLLLHKPNGLLNGETDDEVIQRKKVHISIAWVLVHSRLDFWTKEKALHLWINQFLPKFNPAIFTSDQLLRM